MFVGYSVFNIGYWILFLFFVGVPIPAIQQIHLYDGATVAGVTIYSF